MLRFGALIAASMLAAGAIVFSPGPAAAWDDEGHMIVAAIAYERLERR